jgi:ribonuclease HII
VHRARWTTIERELRLTGGTLICGVDEVGRGSLAGPVVACAIVMPHDTRALRGVDDSKMLTPLARERLVSQIMQRAVSLGLGAASAREIDRLNIYHASTLAMRRALARLKVSPDHVLIDGRPIRALGVKHQGIVDGDDKCFSIACASIVAKVTRDRLMASLSRRHPHYAWDHNCGYATRRHIDALQSHGSCAHHRQSFVVKALIPGEIVLEIIADADTDHIADDFPESPPPL